jgi:flagellar protein FliS
MRPYANTSYQEAEILSAEPLQLVQLLYRGALDEIVRARGCLAMRDIAGRSRAVNKAIRIVAELALSLNHEQGGEISRSLVELYDYTQRLLIDANCRQVDGPLAEAQKLMTTLQEAWEHYRTATHRSAGGQQDCEYTPISCAG